MKQWMRIFFLFLFLTVPTMAQADAKAVWAGAQAAIEGHDQVIDEFSNFEFTDSTHTALNLLVGEGIEAMRDAGFTQDADRMEREWAEQSDDFFFLSNDFGTLNLGDHTPLNQWLANFYRMLRSRIGDRINGIQILVDLNVMNFAIPVVFQPRGDRRNNDHWDRAEYARHFIPFSGVVTYWVSYGGCRIALREHDFLRNLCSIAAGLLKRGMQTYVAPRLSDFIYRRATGNAEFDAVLALDRSVMEEQYLTAVRNIKP